MVNTKRLPNHVQRGSEISTSLDFEWSERGWVANDPDFEWDLKSGQKRKILNGPVFIWLGL